MKVMKKVAPKAILIAVCALVVFWLSSLTICEYDTAQHGEEFRGVVIHDIGGVRTLETEKIKVVRYHQSEAEVYTTDPQGGNLYWFQRDSEGKWVYTAWDSVWSTAGNADDYVFPYIRIEGLIWGRNKR